QQLADPSDRARVAAIRAELIDYLVNYTEPLIGHDRPTTAAGILKASNEGDRRLKSLRDQFAVLNRAQQGDVAPRRARSQELRRRMVVIGAGGVAVTALLVALLGFAIQRFI